MIEKNPREHKTAFMALPLLRAETFSSLWAASPGRSGETRSFKTTLVLKRLWETSQRKVTGVGLPAHNRIWFWYGNKDYQTEIWLLSTQTISKGMLRFRHRCPSELSFTGASPQAQPLPLAGRAQQPAAGTVAPREKRWAAPPGMGWSDGMQRGCKPTDRSSEHHSKGHDTRCLHISILTLNTHPVQTRHEKGGKISIVDTGTTLA